MGCISVQFMIKTDIEKIKRQHWFCVSVQLYGIEIFSKYSSVCEPVQTLFVRFPIPPPMHAVVCFPFFIQSIIRLPNLEMPSKNKLHASEAVSGVIMLKG